MRLRRIAGDVLLWLLLSVLLPLNGQRIDEGAYINGLIGASVLLAVAVAVRRSAPLAALLLAAALLPADIWLAGPFAVLAFLVGLSSVRPRPALLTFGGVAGIGSALTLVLAIVSGGDRWVAYYLLAVVVFCGIFPWLAGRYFRQRRELAVGGWALAEELERGQTLVAERARMRERARIAEDMHDALGHELSLLALRAGALELDPSLGPAQRATAADLREGAAAATERLRTVIGVLRAGAGAPLQPADETIDTLVERARRAGLTIDWLADGTPDAPDLPPLADRALYRVVQEGLTNATRHAPGTPVTGRLTIGPDAVTVTLSNPADPPRAVAAERGTGLLALAERVRVAGGTLATDRSGGTFTLAATVPRTPAAAVTSSPAEPEPPAGPVDPSPGATGTVPVATESAGRLATARQRTRRVLVLAVAVPVLAGALLAGTVIGGYVIETKASVLSPSAVARLHVGQPESQARDLLPLLEVTERPDVPEPPVPDGAECSYYSTSGTLFPPLKDVYRICFAERRVVRIDLIPERNARGDRG